MLEELGISLGTAIVILIAMYCVIKGAIKSAIEDASCDIRKAVTQGIRDYHDGKAYEEDEETEEGKLGGIEQRRDYFA